MQDETEVETSKEDQNSVLSRLLATETGSFVLIFFGILGTLTILTVLGQERFVLIVGSGALLAFLAIMLLSSSDRVYEIFSDKQRGPVIGLAIIGIFIILLWIYSPEDSTSLTVLAIIVSIIFLIWTIAQAYFMSVPISTTSAQLASNFEVETKHKAYTYLVLGASVALPAIFYPYLSWKILPILVNDAGRTLDLLWVLGMIGLVGILWVLLLRFLRPVMEKQDAIIFGGVFFTIYMLFIFYRSLFFLAKLHDVIGGTTNTSLFGAILDVIFMITTIILAIYSFSKRAFGVNLPVLNKNNSIFVAFAFGSAYASAQLYLVAGADNAQSMITTISLISHLLIFICAIVVLLFIPYSYVIAKGYIVPTPFREAFALKSSVDTPEENFSHIKKEVVEEPPVEEPLDEEDTMESITDEKLVDE